VTTAPQPLPGRPRDPQKDIDVLAATRELLVEEGYQATTIVAIARRAGVGAPTIYRRWPRREAIIEDAVFGEIGPTAIPTSTGELRKDLHAWTWAFIRQFADPVTRAAIPGLLMAYEHDVDLYERLVNRTEHDVREQFSDLLRGYLTDLPPTELRTRTDAIFDFLVATTVIRALTFGLVDYENFCMRTADALTALANSTWKTPRRRGPVKSPRSARR
jgi:AcrR family transcriptional regulator